MTVLRIIQHDTQRHSELGILAWCTCQQVVCKYGILPRILDIVEILDCDLLKVSPSEFSNQPRNHIRLTSARTSSRALTGILKTHATDTCYIPFNAENSGKSNGTIHFLIGPMVLLQFTIYHWLFAI